MENQGRGSNGGQGRAIRSFGRDRSVLNEKVAPGTARRILEFAAPHKVSLLIFMGLVIIDAGVSAVIPLVYRQIINRGIVGHNEKFIIHFALLAAALAVVSAGLTLSERYLTSKVGQGLIFDMRTKIFAHVQKMSLAFFTRVQTGALVSRLNNDVQGAQDAFTNILSTVIGNLISVIVQLVVMLFLSAKITIIALILLPVFILPARRIGQRLREVTREGYDLTAQMNTTMIEHFNVSGALLSKLFGRPSTDSELFNTRAARVRDIGILQSLYQRFFFVSLGFTASLATAIVYGWGGIQAVEHILDVGTVIALTTYLRGLYGPLTSLSNIQVDVMTSLVSFERVFEVLDLPPLIAEKENAVPLAGGAASINFEHVRFSYPSATDVSLASLESVATLDQVKTRQVLSDLSFSVKPGQMAALVGHSGAGKTTIIQLLSRLYDVDSGSISINGIDLRDATLRSISDRIGVVTQDAHMFHDTIRANLLYAKPDASEQELEDALEKARILSLIRSLPRGLDTMVGDRGYRLSGGERQRLAIARVILKAPDIIILDEATAHLDSKSEHAIQLALATVLNGRTSVVIAHRLSTIQKADKILVIDSGRIVEEGTHEELLKNGGLYTELYSTQFSKPDSLSSLGLRSSDSVLSNPLLNDDIVSALEPSAVI